VAVAAVAIVGLVAGGLLSRFTAGVASGGDSTFSRSVIAATLSIHYGFAKGNYPHYYNWSAAACYPPGSSLHDCNVTLTCVRSGGCNQIASINYSVLGSNLAPTSFNFISSDPGFPDSLAQVYQTSTTLSLGFYVIPHAGTISAFVQFNYT
jgi:hypothetical protein